MFLLNGLQSKQEKLALKKGNKRGACATKGLTSRNTESMPAVIDLTIDDAPVGCFRIENGGMLSSDDFGELCNCYKKRLAPKEWRDTFNQSDKLGQKAKLESSYF